MHLESAACELKAQIFARGSQAVLHVNVSQISHSSF
jgi:hypothetical protein